MGICQGKGVHENTAIKPVTPKILFDQDHPKLTAEIIKEW